MPAGRDNFCNAFRSGLISKLDDLLRLVTMSYFAAQKGRANFFGLNRAVPQLVRERRQRRRGRIEVQKNLKHFFCILSLCVIHYI